MLCPNCKKRIGNVSFCPNCGVNIAVASKYFPQKKKGSLLLKIFGILFIIGIIGSFADFMALKDGYYLQDNNTTTQIAKTSSNTKQKSKPNLEILDYKYKQKGYSRYIIGHIKNNSNKTYSYVQVSINSYNNDTLVNSTIANVNNLEAGNVWDFKAIVSNDDFNKYLWMWKGGRNKWMVF